MQFWRENAEKAGDGRTFCILQHSTTLRNHLSNGNWANAQDLGHAQDLGYLIGQRTIFLRNAPKLSEMPMLKAQLRRIDYDRAQIMTVRFPPEQYTTMC